MARKVFILSFSYTNGERIFINEKRDEIPYEEE